MITNPHLLAVGDENEWVKWGYHQLARVSGGYSCARCEGMWESLADCRSPCYLYHPVTVIRKARKERSYRGETKAAAIKKGHARRNPDRITMVQSTRHGSKRHVEAQ